MPVYQGNPFTPVQLLQKGVPAYLIGSLNMLKGNGQGFLTQTNSSGTVATVSVTLLNGPTPQIGDVISIKGSTTSSGGFNVNRATITNVTWTAATATGTITFATTVASQGNTADHGSVVIEPGEIGETVAATYTSAPICVQAPQGDSQFTLPWALSAGAGLTAFSASLQMAIRDVATEYVTAITSLASATGYGNATMTASGVMMVTLQRGYFYRVAITGVTGSDVVVSKIG